MPIKPKSVILQASFSYHASGNLMHFSKLSGEERCSFRVLATDQISDILARLKRELGSVDGVLPGAQLLSKVISQDPLATLEPFM